MGECAQASQPPLPAYSLQAIHGLPFEQAALAAWAHAPLAAELRKKRWSRQLGPGIVSLAIRPVSGLARLCRTTGATMGFRANAAEA